MATLGEMTTNVANYLSRADLNTEIQDAIRRAVKYYERKMFFFNEGHTSASLTTSSSQAAYNVPDDFAYDLNLMFTNNGHRYPLEKRTQQWIESIDVSDIFGQPSYYSVYNGQIHYYPVPNQSHTVSLTYIKKAQSLTAVGSSNLFTLNAQDLIEARACWWVATMKMRNTPLAQEYKKVEMDAETALVGETEQRATSNKVEAHGL